MGRRVTNEDDAGIGGAAEVATHILDLSDAHDASAISLDSSGFTENLPNTLNDVQAFAQYVDQMDLGIGSGSGDPTGAAGGELTGTYPNPSVATSHSGNTHADVQAAAEATAAAQLALHIADIASAHVAQAVNVDDDLFAGFLTGMTTAQTALAAVDAITAGDVPVDAALFAQNLDGTVTSVQLLAEAVDALTFGNLVTSVNSQIGAVVLDADAVGAIGVGLLGVADGVATLDGTGHVEISQWPDFVSEVNGLTGEVLVTGADIPLAADDFAGNLDNTVTDVQLLAEAVDALTVSGGSAGHTIRENTTGLTARASLNFAANLTATDNAGTNSTDVKLSDDVVMPNMVLTSAGTGTLAGGKITNVSALGLGQTYTQTVAPDGADLAVGVPLRINQNVTYDGNDIPGSVIDSYGPRATVNLEGHIYYSQPMSPLNISPLSFGTMIRMGNTPGIAINKFGFGWGYMDSTTFIADGAAVTVQRNDYHTGGSAFVDARAYVTANSGTWNGSGEIISYLSGVFCLGNSSFARRIAFDVKKFNHYNDSYTEAEFAALLADDSNGPAWVPNADELAGTVGEEMGMRIPRLVAGTTANLGIKSDAPFLLWSDTNTFTAAPTDTRIIKIAGTHTFNYTAPVVVGFEILGTWSFQHAASALSGFTALNLNPFLKTHSSLTGTWMTNNTFVEAAPTYMADTGAVTIDSLYGVSYDPTFSRTAGGTLAVAADYGFNTSATVGAGVTVTDRLGVYVADATGAGTVTSQVGIFIEALAKGTTTNTGIVNLSSSVLQGDVYGGLVSGTNLHLLSNAGTNNGSILLDAPGIELFSSGATFSTSAQRALVYMDATITMGGTPLNRFDAISLAPIIEFSQDGTGTNGVGYLGVFEQATVRNSGTGNRALGSIVSFASNPVISCNAAGGGNTVSSIQVFGYDSHPYFTRVTSGSLVIDDSTGFVSHMDVGANTTVTVRKGFDVRNPNNSGTLTTNYGLYVENQTTGTTNWGIYNLGTSRFGKAITLGGETKTAGYNAIVTTETFNMNAGSLNAISGFTWGPTVTYDQVGFASGAAFTVLDQATYKNVTSEANNLGLITSFVANPVITADTATITAAYLGVSVNPTTSRLVSGGLTITDVTGFDSELTIGANTTVTSRTGMYINDATGAGTLTTNIGLWIDAQAKGTTNIGLRNASTTVLTPTTKTITAVGDTIPCTASIIRLNNTSGSSKTLTSAPTIADGQSGQDLYIRNTSAQNVVVQDQGTLASSNLRLYATTVTIGTRQTLHLQYDSTVGDWVQVSPITTVL